MDMKYTKVPFSEGEKILLQNKAKARGKRLNQYIREVLFSERSCEIEFGQDVLEAHTKALNEVRNGLKGIYWAPMEDKILLSGFFLEMHEKMSRMEQDEAKIRRDIRRIRMILQGENQSDVEGDGTVADI